MRTFHIQGQRIQETDQLPSALPERGGFVWIACARREFEVMQGQIQAMLQSLCGVQLVDLHLSDLLNQQLPSHYDYTSQYDVMVFRRLSTRQADTDPAHPGEPLAPPARRGGPPLLRRIDTSPVGFAVFDQILLTVHPTDCAVRDSYAARLMSTANGDRPPNGGRVPVSPADLMLRLVNVIVDGYLELRRELTRQLDHWQTELLKPKTRFTNWGSLLDARMALHLLDDICEDQRSAVQDWLDTLQTWPKATSETEQVERDLLRVRSRDVLEHIERVVHHVRRLEQNIETAVQMHFSVQSNRTNDIMRTLTALTAVFLPLNLIAGIFGMNFEFIPLIHQTSGFWWAMAAMGVIAVLLVLLFWRKQYLARER